MHGGTKLPRSLPRWPRLVALALALATLLALAACDQSAAPRTSAQPTGTQPVASTIPTAVLPTAMPAGLPTFSDWRAAYLSSD